MAILLILSFAGPAVSTIIYMKRRPSKIAVVDEPVHEELYPREVILRPGPGDVVLCHHDKIKEGWETLVLSSQAAYLHLHDHFSSDFVGPCQFRVKRAQ